jgi:hypothetical protein
MCARESSLALRALDADEPHLSALIVLPLAIGANQQPTSDADTLAMLVQRFGI